MNLILSDEYLSLLKKQAKLTKKPVTQLILEAIKKTYGRTDSNKREEALKRLFAQDSLPMGDWDTVKTTLLKRYE